MIFAAKKLYMDFSMKNRQCAKELDDPFDI